MGQWNNTLNCRSQRDSLVNNKIILKYLGESQIKTFKTSCSKWGKKSQILTTTPRLTGAKRSEICTHLINCMRVTSLTALISIEYHRGHHQLMSLIKNNRYPNTRNRICSIGWGRKGRVRESWVKPKQAEMGCSNIQLSYLKLKLIARAEPQFLTCDICTL